MTVQRGVLITVACGLCCACAGALLGMAVGMFAPDYYRVVFHLPPDMQFNPVQIGLGLGLTQGLAAGLLVGLVIVVTVAWYELRVKRNGIAPDQGLPTSSGPGR